MKLPRGLHRLARAWGVQTAFHDHRGRRVHASVETLLAVLRELGAPLDGLADVPGALDAHRRARILQALPPVLVAWDGRLTGVELHLPDEAVTRGRIAGRVDLEQGEPRAVSADLAGLPAMGRARLDGRGYHSLRLPLELDLPPGVHRLALSVDGRELQAPTPDGRAWVLAAPTRLENDLAARSWGAFLPLFALRSERSWGCGDFTDLARLADWLGERGGRVLATLPLLATFLDEPLFQPSPYVPVSRMAWSELWIDPTREPEWSHPSVRTLVDEPAWRQERETLQRAPLHDYRRLAALRRPVLAAMARQAFASGRRSELEALLVRQPHLDEYARFRSACLREGRSWHGWSDGAVARGAGGENDPDWQLHVWIQHAARRQLADVAAGGADGTGTRLLLDLPVGVHPDGFDVWRHRELFALGASCGAPPDGFFARGQDWGFPPLRPEALRADGYAYTRGVLRHHLAHGRVLRVDHALGLHRMYWVPRGHAATDGVYVRQHPEEWYALLCLEASRTGAVLVGEDLGTVPRGLRADLKRHGVLRTHVLQFAPRSRVPRAAVACLNTHDLPPFAGFLRGDDIETFHELGLVDELQRGRARAQRAQLTADLRTWLEERRRLQPGTSGHELMQACHARLAESRAALVVVNLEDLWDEDRPHNVPGTSDERPNWRRPARHGFERFREDARVVADLAEIDARRRRPRARTAREARADARPEIFGAMELELFAGGVHVHAYDLLGSRRTLLDGVPGVRFATWAPGAEGVTVIGDFNDWDHDRHALSPVGDSGLWATFVPGVRRGGLYKYRVRADGAARDLPDPFARRHEASPGDASMIWSLDHDWADGAWLETRREFPAPPVEEGVLSTGGEVLRAAALVARAREQGAGHVRLGVFGDGLVPAAAFAVPQELMTLVDDLHGAGLGVVLPWAPDPARWPGTTRHDRPELASLLLSAAFFRVELYHVDVLAVRPHEALPAGLLERLAELLAERHPGVHVLREG